MHIFKYVGMVTVGVFKGYSGLSRRVFGGYSMVFDGIHMNLRFQSAVAQQHVIYENIHESLFEMLKCMFVIDT